ncbi:MAG: DUF6036 family nucleotidyltransferase, partial [Nanoarchaeota archaeon]
MISIEGQQKLLVAISEKLRKKVTVYAVGGTAMMLLGIKDATLDIDLVFDNEKDRDEFKKAAKSIGYKEMDAVKVYGTKENRPDMMTLGDERFDMFLDKVISFHFSKEMKKRAVKMHQFGDSLMLKVADPHDIILMKCATDRAKDRDDARKIANTKDIDWNIIIEEAKSQVKLGMKSAILDLGYFLEDLSETMKVKIPKKVLDAIFDILKMQI